MIKAAGYRNKRLIGWRRLAFIVASTAHDRTVQAETTCVGIAAGDGGKPIGESAFPPVRTPTKGFPCRVESTRVVAAAADRNESNGGLCIRLCVGQVDSRWRRRFSKPVQAPAHCGTVRSQGASVSG